MAPSSIQWTPPAEKPKFCSNVRAGRGAWKCACGWQWREDEDKKTRPNCPHCGQDTTGPKVPANRVHGASYLPYDDGSHWADFANADMKSETQKNFQYGRR